MRKPFVWVFVLLSLGIFAGEYVPARMAVVVWSYAAALFLGLVFFRFKRLSLFFLGLSFVALGVLLITNTKTFSPYHISYSLKFCREGPVELEGIIVSEIQEKKFFKTPKYMFTLEAKRLKGQANSQGWRRKTGRVLVTVFGQRDLHYGDRVRLTGRLYPPFDFDKEGKFSYKEYLGQKNILVMMSVKKTAPVEVLARGEGNFIAHAAFRLRARLARIFYSSLTENEAALMEGMLLGERSRIPRGLNDIFVRTGTAHILAISGMNVGIVAFMVFLLLRLFPLGRRTRLGLTMAILVFHAVLTGAQPPVMRATVMACVFLAAFWLEREADTLNSLAFAGIVLLVFNPQNIFNVGFQLSFVSVFAIVYFYPIIRGVCERIFRSPRLPRALEVIVELVLFSLAAWIGTLGLIAHYFEMVTPITIAANLVVVPVLTPVVVFGTGLLLCGVLWPPAAFLFALSTKVTLNLMVGFILLLSRLPFASFTVKGFSLAWTVTYYIAVMAVFFAFRKFAKPEDYR